MKLAAFFVLFAIAAPEARADGTVKGRVVVLENGKPAKRDEVWMYLERVKPRRRRKDAAAPPTREIRQEKEQFAPHVLVVPVGTTVAFPNYDRIEHNVFSPSDPPGQFDLGRYNTDHKGKQHTFEDPADVSIFCDIHRQMWARIKIVDADPGLIVKVDADGAYAVSAVPAGTYTLHIWTYDSAEVVQKNVEVADGATVTADEAHVQLGTTPDHLRKDGSKYTVYKPH
jgi:plastocyanin